MDYSSFHQLILNHQEPSQADVVSFGRLPNPQKETLFKFACLKDESSIAKKLFQRLISTPEFLGKIVTEVLSETTYDSTATLEWLFSLNPTIDFNVLYKKIISKQTPRILEFIFSRYPLNDKHMFYLLTHCINTGLEESLDWILEKQKQQKLPYNFEMYYWSLYSADRAKKPLGINIMKSLIYDYPQDLSHIKTLLNYPQYALHFLEKIVIKNKEPFRISFNQLESTCLKEKIENELKKNDSSVKTKRLKI